MDCVFKKCGVGDVKALRALSVKTYGETFAPFNSQENLRAYLEGAFREEKLLAELQNEDSAFYFAYCGVVPAGYIKVNESPAQTDIGDATSLEIERLYVSREFQGRGIGAALMQFAVNLAAQRKKRYVWLGVWEKNEKALRFYRKQGFYWIGAHPFVMGDDVQTDDLMRKDL